MSATGNSGNGYHAYEVSKPRDIPANILKQLLKDNGIIEFIGRGHYRKI